MEDFVTDNNNQGEVEVTVDVLLDSMELSEHKDYFSKQGITTDVLLHLNLAQLKLLFPAPQFNFGTMVYFMQKYTKFMRNFSLDIDPSLISGTEDKDPSPESVQNDKDCISSLVDCKESESSPINGQVVQNDKNCNPPPAANIESESSVPIDKDNNNSTSEDSEFQPSASDQSDSGEDEPLAKFCKRGPMKVQNAGRKCTSVQNRSKTQLNGDQQHSSSAPAASAEKAVNQQRSSSASAASAVIVVDQQRSSPASAAAAEKLVDRSKVGAKRKLLKEADKDIADLNLKTHLSTNPIIEAIINNYEDTSEMFDADRATILSQIVPWLLSKTKNPTKNHYEKLTSKIVDLFPHEQASVWYLAPFTESAEQKNPKGLLPNRVKNNKTKLRKKGALPPRRKKLELPEPAAIRERCTPEETVAINWLKRNLEAEEDLRKNWRLCSRPRLKELLVNNVFTPVKYIESWNDILKLPSVAYKLVVDDFEVLPEVCARYEPLRGKANALLTNWTKFAEYVSKLLDCPKNGLKKEEVNEFKALLNSASDENGKDYVILQLLPLLCKQKGRVKVGNVCFKPSAEESRSAFMLQVPVAAEVEEYKRKRVDKYTVFKATNQPYILVVSEVKNSVRDVYVVVIEAKWIMSSILQAVDVCFKAFFSLNSDYPPEANHIWLLLQNALYEAHIEGDTLVGTVTSFLANYQRFPKE